ncbi:MAG TPA: HSP18 transcriptional regulator, partial [Pseudonocardiaceae bacterium]|nr:HSP18 transcriptional regulator [Pseudonocardiaceae bacterium]
MFDPEESLRRINEAVGRADVTPADLLTALAELHRLRDLLTAFEPELIGAARDHGVSWAALAEVLGVASRQAAERRYLRLRPAEPAQPSASRATGQPASTGDERVRAVRDRRAADRAVSEWARRNSAMLRQLAGNVSSLDDLATPARRHADLVQQ